jgi:hypothetical protein
VSSDWIRADWPAPSNIIAGSTTRLGGVSNGRYRSLNLGGHVGDQPGHVAENRRRFVEMCDLPEEPFWLKQVHGTQVVSAGSKDVDDGPPEADAAIGRGIGDSCAITTADCVPILLCSTDGDEIAAAHAGWRGLAGGIVAATVNEMSATPGSLIAWLGPAISQDSFEVGDNVRDAFIALDAESTACFRANDCGRWQADLYGLARRWLAAAGVSAVHGGEYCTAADPQRFFSHRRDGSCGRMATFIHRHS